MGVYGLVNLIVFILEWVGSSPDYCTLCTNNDAKNLQLPPVPKLTRILYGAF